MALFPLHYTSPWVPLPYHRHSCSFVASGDGGGGGGQAGVKVASLAASGPLTPTTQLPRERGGQGEGRGEGLVYSKYREMLVVMLYIAVYY